MLNLLALIVFALLTLLCWVFYLRASAGSAAMRGQLRLAVIPLYAITLLLTLRFGARAYPGVYIPTNETLNWLFNGSRVFALGYWLTLLAASSDLVSVLGTRRSLPLVARVTLGGVASSAATLVVAIATYGLLFAAALQRLPH